jgi:hypothetical protein
VRDKGARRRQVVRQAVSDDAWRPEPLEVLVAVETLLVSGFTEEAVCVLTKVFKNKQEMREAMMAGLKL